MQSFIIWVQDHVFELLGTITGLLYIYYAVIQDIRAWFYGLVSSLFQLFFFFKVGIYADMAIQVYYVFASMYGWYFWKYGKIKKDKGLPVLKMDFFAWMIFVVSTIAIYIVIRFILVNYTDSTVPGIDSFTSALSITGTVLLARKYIENWMVWIVVNVCSIGLYIYKGQYIINILYLVLTVMAVVGYRKWKKDLLNA